MIQIYWKNATAQVVGEANGLTPADLTGVDPLIRQAHGAVMEQIGAGMLGYTRLPQRSDYREQVKDLARRYRENTTDMVVLGIGGSALGNIALQAALQPANYNLLTQTKRGGPRLFVLDNVDPALVDETLRFVRRRAGTLLVNVISKSGETAETAGEFMIFREMLRKRLGADFAGRIVVTTDTQKGTLHDIAKADGCAILPVPDDVGGRFSVLSPVGLFSAAMCGIDIDAILSGAAAMKTRVEDTADCSKNPACILAAIKYLAFTAKGKSVHVMMPYSNRLYALADWYRQLWAESLGKMTARDGREVLTGPTPVKALGTTDQHSQVQLYREGPNDKLIVFLAAAKHPGRIRIPDVFEGIPALAYLRKNPLASLLSAEKTATEYALARSGRPSVTVRFDAISPGSVGEFIYLYEFTTSLMGELLNINAYDQPAVELGKKATFALMGRPGHEELAGEVSPFKRVDRKYLA